MNIITFTSILNTLYIDCIIQYKVQIAFSSKIKKNNNGLDCKRKE